MNITVQFMCVLFSQGMALIKGLNSIYPRKWFCLLQTGKWALKPNAPQPTPHVGIGLVVGNAAVGEQMIGLDKEPTALLKATVRLAAARQSVVYMGGMCDVCRL